MKRSPTARATPTRIPCTFASATKRKAWPSASRTTATCTARFTRATACPACASASPPRAARWRCRPRRAARSGSTRACRCDHEWNPRGRSGMNTLRIALAHVRARVRAGLRALLERQRIETGVEADDGEHLLEQLATQRADVVLSDIRMPRVDGIDALRRLRERGDPTPVLLLTTFDDSDLL